MGPGKDFNFKVYFKRKTNKPLTAIHMIDKLHNLSKKLFVLTYRALNTAILCNLKVKRLNNYDLSKYSVDKENRYVHLSSVIK